jgi:CHAT domain-containing protein/tetratricopeptide (TPR) repeat protein
LASGFSLRKFVRELDQGALLLNHALAEIDLRRGAYLKPSLDAGARVDDWADWEMRARTLAVELTEIIREMGREDDRTRIWQLGQLASRAGALLGPVAEGKCLFFFGSRLWQLGVHEECLAPLQRAEECLKKSEERFLALSALDRRVGALRMLHRSDEALELARRFLAEARSGGYPAFEATALFDLGQIHSELGRVEEARRYQLGALAARDRVTEDDARAAGTASRDQYLGAHGKVARQAGQYEEAVAAFLRALEEQKRRGTGQDAAYTLSEIGFTWQAAGDSDRAQRYLQEAAGLADSLGMRNEARRWGLAVSILTGRQALGPATPPESSRPEEIIGAEAAYGVAAEAEVLLSTGKPDAARALVLQCIAWAKKSGDRHIELRSRINLAGTYLHEGRLFESLAATRVALSLAAEVDDLEAWLTAKGNLGNVLNMIGLVEEAERELKEGIARAEAHLTRTPTAEFRQAFRAGVVRLYEELAVALAVTRDEEGRNVLNPTRHEESLRYSQMIRGMNLSGWLSLRDRAEKDPDVGLGPVVLDLRRVETQIEMAHFGGSVTAARLEQLKARQERLRGRVNELTGGRSLDDGPVDLAELEALLVATPGLCVIDLFSTDQFVFATRAAVRDGKLCVAGAVLHWIRKDRVALLGRLAAAMTPSHGFEGQVKDLAPTPDEGGSAESAEAIFAELDQAFLRPLAELVTDTVPVCHVVIVPHRELHTCPYWALGQRLSEVSVSVVPNLAVFRQLRQRDGVGGGPTLAISDATGTLRFADQECELVARHRGGVVSPRRTDELLEFAREAGVIHFACHGTFNQRNPYLSGVLSFREAPEDVAPDQHEFTDFFGPGAGGKACKLLTVAEITARCWLAHRPLVVISACRSGLPRDHAADEFTSLPGAFLMAGAGGVIASLWPVDDAATFLLMEEFYAAWSGGGGTATSPAAALGIARAHLACMTREEVRRRAPGLIQLPECDHPLSGNYYTMAFQYYGVD